jgi:hypothetical protein
MVESIPSSATAVGSCNWQTQEIKILKSFWDKSDYYTRKQLIFHELGHCFLDLVHRSETQNGIPLSIMYPSVFPSSYFQQYEQDYIFGLFAGDLVDMRSTINNYRVNSKDYDFKNHITTCIHEH